MIGSFCFYISNKHFNLTIMKKILAQFENLGELVKMAIFDA